MKSRPYSRPTPPTSAPRKSQAHWLSGVAGAPTWVLNSFSSPTLHSSTDNDVLCLPGSIESAPGPVLVPTYLQTELVLRCHQETSCDLCVRVTVHLAVHSKQAFCDCACMRGRVGVRTEVALGTLS